MGKVRKAKTSFGRFTTLAVAVAEGVLGKKLPAGAVVHHIDGDHTNDDKSNLAVFPSKAYHNLIHARMDALAACGNADWVPCGYCKKYGDPSQMYVRFTNGRRAWHRACHAEYQLALYYKSGRKKQHG